jgi:hypothetical protein
MYEQKLFHFIKLLNSPYSLSRFGLLALQNQAKKGWPFENNARPDNGPMCFFFEPVKIPNQHLRT